MGGSRSVAAQSTPLMVPFSVPKGNREEGSRGGGRTAVFHSSGGAREAGRRRVAAAALPRPTVMLLWEVGDKAHVG
jgi:hypothetical protein